MLKSLRVKPDPIRPFEPGTGVTVERVYECEPTLDHNAKLRKLSREDGGWTESRDFRRVARIPLGLIVTWRLQGLLPWDRKRQGLLSLDAETMRAVYRLLRSSEWSRLRTSEWSL